MLVHDMDVEFYEYRDVVYTSSPTDEKILLDAPVFKMKGDGRQIIYYEGSWRFAQAFKNLSNGPSFQTSSNRYPCKKCFEFLQKNGKCLNLCKI